MRKPRRNGSHGIRVYFHVNRERMTRESFNYQAGFAYVYAVLKDPNIRLLGVGTESGAMCIHYERVR